MLDGDKLTALIGHASVNSPLDNFLMENGISHRPKGNSGTYDFEDKEHGILFSYYEDEHYSENFFIQKKSDGKFILQGLIFRNKKVIKNQKPFHGKYPFGLNSASKPSDLIKKLGQPRKIDLGDDEYADSYAYAFDMLIVRVGFNHITNALEHVNVHVADKHDRKHGFID